MRPPTVRAASQVRQSSSVRQATSRTESAGARCVFIAASHVRGHRAAPRRRVAGAAGHQTPERWSISADRRHGPSCPAQVPLGGRPVAPCMAFTEIGLTHRGRPARLRNWPLLYTACIGSGLRAPRGASAGVQAPRKRDLVAPDAWPVPSALPRISGLRVPGPRRWPRCDALGLPAAGLIAAG